MSFNSFSAVSQAEGKQKELVRSEPVCGGRGGWTVQEDGEVQQHTQSKMEASAHRVSAAVQTAHHRSHPYLAQ